MRNFQLFCLLFVAISFTAFADIKKDEAYYQLRNSVDEKLKKASKEDFRKLNINKKKDSKSKNINSKLTPQLNNAIQKYNNQNQNNPERMPIKANDSMDEKSGNSPMKIEELPADIKVPGEFDEAQAVLISWPGYCFDDEENFLEPFLPGLGVLYLSHSEYEIREIAGWVTDLYEDSPYPYIWGKLAEAIQQEAEVWIRLSNLEDTTMLKEFMIENFSELKNYRFVSNGEGENAFWMRDFGPYGFYYGDEDSLGLISMEYYPGRPIDDAFPQYIAEKMGVKFYKSEVETEGGNFMTDGMGRGVFSNVLLYSNADTDGMAYLDGNQIKYRKKVPMSNQQVFAEMKRVFNLSNPIMLDHLWCDGGTGHIDIYLKLMNDQTLLYTQYPDEFDNAFFTDWKIINKNLATFGATNTEYDRGFKMLPMPVPTDDNGKYGRTTCDNFGGDARGFINGLIVNKTFIFPSYSDEQTGNKEGDEQAIQKLKEYLPGYKIVPIDSRELTPMGGAIHCITMQIPAENPLTIQHPSYSGFHQLTEPINMTATIYNHSGIAKANCYWRKIGEVDWTEIALVEESDDKYNWELPNSGLMVGDTIEYYISAESNNGKVKNHPITAPEGHHSFYIEAMQSADSDNYNFQNNEIASIAPNPIADQGNLKINIQENNHWTIDIYDSFGRNVNNIFTGRLAVGHYELPINVANLGIGVYYCRMRSNMTESVTKFTVLR